MSIRKSSVNAIRSLFSSRNLFASLFAAVLVWLCLYGAWMIVLKPVLVFFDSDYSYRVYQHGTGVVVGKSARLGYTWDDDFEIIRTEVVEGCVLKVAVGGGDDAMEEENGGLCQKTSIGDKFPVAYVKGRFTGLTYIKSRD